METLTPEKVNKDIQRGREEQKRRVHFMADEESRLVTSINLLREEERDEMRKRDERQAADAGGLTVRKSVLASEVEALEARKAAALEPVDKRENEFRLREAEMERREVAISARGQELAAAEADARDRAERLRAAESSSEERSARLDVREVAMAAAENEVSRSTQELSAKWVSHNEVALRERDAIEARESAVLVATRANEDRAAALDLVAAAQARKDREIADKYATLARARAEFERMKEAP